MDNMRRTPDPVSDGHIHKMELEDVTAEEVKLEVPTYNRLGHGFKCLCYTAVALVAIGLGLGAVLNDGEVGTLGLLMVIAGVFGVIGAGAVLESYPAFKSDDQNNCDETSDSVVTMPPTPCCPASVVASSTLSATSA